MDEWMDFSFYITCFLVMFCSYNSSFLYVLFDYPEILGANVMTGLLYVFDLKPKSGSRLFVVISVIFFLISSSTAFD